MTNSPSNAQSPVYAIYVSCVAALGGLLFGYDTAVIAGTVEFLQKRFSLSDLALGEPPFPLPRPALQCILRLR